MSYRWLLIVPMLEAIAFDIFIALEFCSANQISIFHFTYVSLEVTSVLCFEVKIVNQFTFSFCLD